MECSGTTTLVERHPNKQSENEHIENTVEEKAKSLRQRWKAHRDKITAGVSYGLFSAL